MPDAPDFGCQSLAVGFGFGLHYADGAAAERAEREHSVGHGIEAYGLDVYYRAFDGDALQGEVEGLHQTVSFRASRATLAASCSARDLLRPEPKPSTAPSTSTSAVNVGACGSPDISMMRYLGVGSCLPCTSSCNSDFGCLGLAAGFAEEIS